MTTDEANQQLAVCFCSFGFFSLPFTSRQNKYRANLPISYKYSMLVVLLAGNWDTWWGCCNGTVNENLCARVCGTMRDFFFFFLGGRGRWGIFCCLLQWIANPVWEWSGNSCEGCASRLVVCMQMSEAQSQKLCKESHIHNFRHWLLWVCLSMPLLIPSSTVLFFIPSVFHPLPSLSSSFTFPSIRCYFLWSYSICSYTLPHCSPTLVKGSLSIWISSLSLILSLSPSLSFSLFLPCCLYLYLPPSFIIISSHLHITEASIIFVVRRRTFSFFFG